MKSLSFNSQAPHARTGFMCDLVVVKVCRSCGWLVLLATLAMGGTFSLVAQTNDAPTNAPVPAPEATNAVVTNGAST